ncbi:hypothetical protein ncot_15740 [Nocardioides sp. JQ2195]|uniref:hypothetical protein n=1 Tax=Nocardioides sp. JQ2195 TaxID=2592334 RepID=UPI00143E54D3|nr:hypothetical protein [Nocardioides sp. JQ2195]QIX27875.1 hypothetical protein ncot_15740 [Nocardioides sp. JQ2195]
MSDPSLHDPFLRVVRQEHPDVDLVILPPAATPPRTESPEVLRQARAAVQESRRTLTRLLAETGRPESTMVDLWSTYARTGSRHRIARTLLADLPEAARTLEVVGDWLLAEGWDARPCADGSPRLRAVRADLVLEATGHPTAIEVEIRSVSFPLSDATAASLDEEP